MEIKNKPIELKYTQSESVSTTNTTFKKEENIIQTNSVEKSVPTEKVKNTENNSKKISSDLKIEKSIKFTLQKIKSDKLVFQNNDEIIEYLKNQIKDGKIKIKVNIIV